MESSQEYKLKKLINELKNIRGRHTELISIYIPAGYDINLVMNQLISEQGTAANIKSKQTRKNVTDALEKIIQHLRLFKRTPENGLVIFCGNISEREGIQDIKLWSIEPPEKITTRIYRCDQTFVLEPLEALLKPKDIYGLIAIDNKEATIGLLKGDRYEILKHITSGYSGKHRAGGQSHRRFERLIREQSHEFKVRVGEHAAKAFMENLAELKGIIIGGPGFTKDEFFEGNYLHHELKKKVIAIKDITYTDESGIRELIEKSKDVLSEVKLVRQKELMRKFLKRLVKGEPTAIYGKEVERALELGAVDTLLLSEELPAEEIDRLYEKAKLCNSKVEILPTNFEEGFQLIKTFAGKAALLRYAID